LSSQHRAVVTFARRKGSEGLTCTQHHAELCVVEIRFTILNSDMTGIDLKRKQDIITMSNQKKKSQIPYECKFGDQVLLETPGILQRLSAPYPGPYPVTNIHRNDTIRIQKEIVSETVNYIE
jgi:hypothetical protein